MGLSSNRSARFRCSSCRKLSESGRLSLAFSVGSTSTQPARQRCKAASRALSRPRERHRVPWTAATNFRHNLAYPLRCVCQPRSQLPKFLRPVLIVRGIAQADFLSFELESHPPGQQAPSACSVDSYVRLLPSTCSAATLQAGNGCSYQIPLDGLLGTADLNFQVAVDTCPGTLLPFISIRIGGTGATKLLAPCSTDNDCGAGHKCFDFPRAGLGTSVTHPAPINPGRCRSHRRVCG